MTWKVSPADKAKWPELNGWFAATLEHWAAFLKPIVKELDASEYAELAASAGEDGTDVGGG